MKLESQTKSFKENMSFLLTVLTAFAGVVVYAEMRLEAVEKGARSDLRAEIAVVDEKLQIENQQRREDIREVNQKLDRIIYILNRGRQ